MRYLIFITLMAINTSWSHAKEIKINKSNNYAQSMSKKAIKLNPKAAPIKKKIRNLSPILVPLKPTLNGKFSQQLAYKNSQKKIKTRKNDDQSPQN